MFKPKFSKKPPVEPAPREMPEINQEFTRACAELGKAYFDMKAVEQELNQRLNRLFGLEAEAAKRSQIDAAKPKEEVKADASNDTPSST